MKKNNVSSPLWVMIKREFSTYFVSPIPYIVIGLFLIFSGFLFFSTFFLIGRADLRQFFSTLPLLFAFFIPAITMRMFSEEERSGSLETLLTLPVTITEVVLAKYFSALLFTVTMLLPTIFYGITTALFGNPDIGPIIGGFLGAILLGASFSAIGIFASASTKNQIIAFFIAFAICIGLTMIDNFLFLLPSELTNILSFFSATNHFQSISKGIIDSRDILYFASIIVIFVELTIIRFQSKRA